MINKESARIQEKFDEETKKEIAIQVLLSSIRYALESDPTLLKRIIDEALYQNLQTSKDAQMKINQANLLFGIVSTEERRRWKSKGIDPIFLT